LLCFVRWRVCGRSSRKATPAPSTPPQTQARPSEPPSPPHNLHNRQVPGTYFDALNRNTKLGKAVAAAVNELEHLNDLEMESLAQAEALLKKLGLKGSLFGEAGAPPPSKSKKKGAAGEEEEELEADS